MGIKLIEKKGGNISPVPDPKYMQSILWADLTALRDNSELTPGIYYRITDYETTTVQADTQSAGHLFDIVVLALSENTLSENAHAIHSVRDVDGYFAGSKLQAWKLKYSLNNDVNKYAWADAVNGKGVIYQMIDEYENDLPYDFKNVKFYHNDDNNGLDDYFYTFTAYGKYGNLSVKESTVMNVFVADDSTFGTYNNRIGNKSPRWDDVNQITFELPKNIFFCNYDDNASTPMIYMPSNNIFGSNCFNNIFLDSKYTYYNTIGNDFKRNTIGNDFNYNTIGNGFISNTIGNYFSSNTIGNYFNYNTIGNDFYSNTIGNYFSSNTIGNYFRSNTIGNFFSSNTIGDFFISNTIGNDFISNTIGNFFSSNTIGNGTQTNLLADYVQFCIFENGVRFIDLKSGTNGSVNNYIQNITVSQGVKGVSSINRKVITATRNLAHQVVYKAAGSTEIEV